jgi:hypothetical protein
VSIWFYLEEFFTDIPTLGVAVKRVFTIALVAFVISATLVVLHAPKVLVSVVYFGSLFASSSLAALYVRGRRRR